MKLRKSENRDLIKAAMKFYPFDYGFVLSLEKEALLRMYKYFKNRSKIVSDVVEKELKLALNLLDIILEIDSIYEYSFITNKEFISKYVNIKNWERFISKNVNFDINKPIIKDYLRREKAWYLYNKLKFERMRTWWC